MGKLHRRMYAHTEILTDQEGKYMGEVDRYVALCNDRLEEGFHSMARISSEVTCGNCRRIMERIAREGS